jgi:peptidoglycan hydrolase-like protein with peptidoglycan-binding domain
MPYGSKGETIKTIQEILIRLGYLSSGNNTGYYDPLTKQALENYIKSTQPTNTVSTSTSAIPTNANASPSPANVQPYTFTRSLKLGDKGEDVRQLQIFLNNQGFTIANSGPGSKGNETTFFGLATRNALIRFQNAYRSEILTPFNLSQGTGHFGPATIRKVNNLMRR